MGPTAMNSQPMRIVFVKSAEAKARLKPSLSPGNVDKTMAAPVTAIIAYDNEFYEKMGKLAPQFPDVTNTLGALAPTIREQMASLSATLQAGYLIVAARGLGLDCGPMGGFERAQVDSAFFPDGRWKSLLLVNLGYGDPSKLYPRAPRLDFDEACKVL
jgi:3-hydroxypropanoate dehydrogenase